MPNKNISLHPKLVAVIDLGLNLSLVWFLSAIKFWWLLLVVFLLRQILWLVFIRFTYYPTEGIKWRHFLSLFLFSIGAFLLLIFIEKNLDWASLTLAWYVFAVIFVLVTFSSFWFLPSSKVGLAVFHKPHMRLRFIMSAMGLSGTFTGINAVISFQIAYGVNHWVWYLLASSLSAAVAGWWWWEYGLKYGKSFLINLLIFWVLMLELIWVFSVLPLGYIINGLILIWIWYLAWLLIRFNLSAEGIIWKKQARFLLFNLCLLVFLLTFIVKWK